MGAVTSSSATPDCYGCRHFVNDPVYLEHSLPGLNILSSAWGSTRGSAGLCMAHGTWQDPERNCLDFDAHTPAVFPLGAARVTER